MGQFISLESFDANTSEDTSATADYQKGYEEGYASGIEAANAAAVALTEQCVQSLNSIDFTYTEARAQLLGALAPLINQIMTKVLPHCVENGFVGQLTDILINAAETDAENTMTLHVHPDQQTAVETAAKQTAAKVIVKGDPSLSDHAAWIQQGRSETLLDVDGLLDAIGGTLQAIQHFEERTETHG